MPGRKAIGMNTAISTSAVATTGPTTSAVARRVASRGSTPPSSRCRWVFSTTTMASSTTMPMARTRPKRVSVLIEKPKAPMTANVPTRDTGMVSVGIRVVRQSWRNTYTVRTTSAMAMKRVSTTSSIDTRTNSVVLYGRSWCTPLGKLGASRAMAACTPRDTWSALAPGSWNTPTSAEGLPPTRPNEP